jgi:hypothetical protein
MSAVADLVGRLIAAGTPADVAAVVVAEAFAAGVMSADVRRQSTDETAERRRIKDRDRKRLERGSPPKSVEVGGSPPMSADTPLNLSSLSRDLEKKERKKVRARAAQLSADWQPSQAHFEAAERLRISRSAVLEKAEDMRLWARSKAATKVDWDATFHGFLRRDAKSGQANGQPKSLVDTIDRTIERNGGMAAARAYVPGSAGPRDAEPDRLDFGQGPPSIQRLPSR